MMDIEYERRLTATEGKTASNSRRLEAIEKRQTHLEELVGTVKVLATRQESVESDVKEIKTDFKEVKNDVKELTAKPGKRWDAIVDKVLLTVIGAILLYILARLGF